MIFGESSFFQFVAIGAILIFLASRIARLKRRGLIKKIRAEMAVFDRHHLPTTKKCPNCAEALALSTLICESCQYNFLSRTVGGRNRALPPSAPLSPDLAQRA
jgi:hypothetical protein